MKIVRISSRVECMNGLERNLLSSSRETIALHRKAKEIPNMALVGFAILILKRTERFLRLMICRKVGFSVETSGNQLNQSLVLLKIKPNVRDRLLFVHYHPLKLNEKCQSKRYFLEGILEITMGCIKLSLNASVSELPSKQ